MPPDDDTTSHNYTYNELTNEEKEWLRRNGYEPGELSPREIREQMAAERDTDENSQAIGEIADEMDGTDADAS